MGIGTVLLLSWYYFIAVLDWRLLECIVQYCTDIVLRLC